MDDPRILSVKRRGRKATIFLFGYGSGPDGEGVRILATEIKTGGLSLWEVLSHEHVYDDIELAYAWLKIAYGTLFVRDVQYYDVAFNRRMVSKGLVDYIDYH